MSISQNFPNTRPSLVLDFANSKKLDSRITFTRGSTGTYMDDNGLVRTAGINQPRFDHDPVTGDSLGLLIEEARTNLISYSQDFTNALWQTGSNRATCDATTGIDDPSGGTTASRWSSGTSVSQELIYRQTGTSTGVLTGQTCTKSIWIRRVSNNGTVSLFIGDNVGVSVNSQLDSVPVGTWVRCSITRTIVGNNGDTRNYIAVYPGTDGQPTTIDIWGDQVEIGSFPTSYIPTVASTVTRSADSALMIETNFSSWYNQTEGTYITSARYDGTPRLALDNRTVFNVMSGLGAIYWNAFWEANNRAVFIVEDPPGTYHAVLSSGDTISIGQTRKTASVYKTNDFAFTANGNVPSTDTSGAITSTAIRLCIGNLNLYYWHLNGRIGKIAYYPVRLSNDELQTLTK
jgi:hypothetical protein